jgi:hypothetical protein
LIDAGLDPNSEQFKKLILDYAQSQIEGKRKGQTTDIKLTLPGEGKGGAVDISKFRGEVQSTVKPYRETVAAADTALAAIEESIKSNNPTAFDLARRQLIKSSGDSQISRTDIEKAGGDPSLLGGAVDAISVAFTATPSIPTQNNLRRTIKIMRKLAIDKGNNELSIQRKIGDRAGYAKEDMDLIFNVPEFNKPSKGSSKPNTPTKGGKQTVTLKNGKVLTVEQEP